MVTVARVNWWRCGQTLVWSWQTPVHDWAAGAAKLANWPRQLTKDCQPSDCTEEHYVSLPGMEHMSAELRKNIWLFIYMALHWTLPNRLINITLHIHIRVHLWLAIWCIMTCIMIVSHMNRLENFSQSPCTVPSCRYFLTLIVLHPPGWDCVAVCIP